MANRNGRALAFVTNNKTQKGTSELLGGPPAEDEDTPLFLLKDTASCESSFEGGGLDNATGGIRPDLG